MKTFAISSISVAAAVVFSFFIFLFSSFAAYAQPGSAESMVRVSNVGQSDSEKGQDTSSSSSRDALTFVTKESRRPGAFPSEKTNSDVDYIIFSIRNSAYHIYTAIQAGEIKAGDTVADLEAKVPNAFTATSKVHMNIAWDPTRPKMFSICATRDGGDNEKLENSVLFDGSNNTFKPGIFNCTMNNSDVVSNPFSEMKLTYPEPVPTAMIPENFILGSAEDAIRVPAPEEPKKDDTPAPQPSTPVEIPWGIILIGIVGIVGIFTISNTGFRLYNAGSKAKEKSRLRNLNIQEWNAIVNRYEAVAKEWASYELDPVRILDFPLMSDMRESNTVQFHSSLRKAKNLKPGNLKDVASLPARESAFSVAVDQLENAFSVAETEAKRVRWNNFSADEKKRLQRAKNLLNLAMDGGATDSERQAAYKRMQHELDGLIVVPKATLLALEKKVSLMLTDGTIEDANATTSN